jgi:mutator protein MutT
MNDDKLPGPEGSVSTSGQSSQPRNFIEVSAGLVFRHGLLLITRRKPDAHLGGLWEFPGGKINEGESAEDCLKRELMEELGIEVEIKELIETVEHDYPEKSVRLKFFRCEWLRNEPKAVGCEDFAWIGQPQLANYSFPPADAQLLQKLQTMEELWR